MSPLSSLHNPDNFVRWGGPVVAALGLVPIALIILTQQRGFFDQWLLSQVLAPERILPVVGLGFACGLVSPRSCTTAFLLFIAGIIAGFAAYDRVIFLLYTVLHAPGRFSVTGPISCLAAGLPLLLSRERLRAWLLPVAAFVQGTMLSIAIFLNDPSPENQLFTCSPLIVAFWIIVAVSLTVRAFRHDWLVIFGRILGSWTVAIGILYGGASIALVLRPTSPSSVISPEPARGAQFNPSIEGENAVEGKTVRNPPWRSPGEFELHEPQELQEPQ